LKQIRLLLIVKTEPDILPAKERVAALLSDNQCIKLGFPLEITAHDELNKSFGRNLTHVRKSSSTQRAGTLKEVVFEQTAHSSEVDQSSCWFSNKWLVLDSFLCRTGTRDVLNYM
jgi:hypothetical protein